MATQEVFGKLTQQETTDIDAFTSDLEKLLSGIHNFNGVLERGQFNNKLDAAIAIIDDLNTSLKPILQQIKTDINA